MDVGDVATRAQDAAVERLALKHGRVHVRHRYLDRHIEATVPSGECHHITEAGATPRITHDFSIDWSE